MTRREAAGLLPCRTPNRRRVRQQAPHPGRTGPRPSLECLLTAGQRTLKTCHVTLGHAYKGDPAHLPLPDGTQAHAMLPQAHAEADCQVIGGQVREHRQDLVHRQGDRHRGNSTAIQLPPLTGLRLPVPQADSPPREQLSALARNFGDVLIGGQAARGGAVGSCAARRLSRRSRSDLVNFHWNGAAICW